MRYVDKIINRENLFWAWEKVKFCYHLGDFWFDEFEIAEFEANLEQEFDDIIKDIQGEKYTLKEIKPLGYPKNSIDEFENPETRQMFWISVRDQVTWVALINIIGPTLDFHMPSWSYGNRLFMSVWYAPNEDDEKELHFGWYRNTSKYIFRKWNQSWPLFRRHIGFTIKRMCRIDKQLDKTEEEIINVNDALKKKKYIQLHLKYLDKDFWTEQLSGNLYWASIDFEKFYPNARLSVIKKNILKYISNDEIDERFNSLLTALLGFRVDFEGWNDDELSKIMLNKEIKSYQNIPTGLFVGGFLSNVLLLEIDQRIDNLIVESRKIAHFRFVDDHIFLCDDFDYLVNWIEGYSSKLDEFGTGAQIKVAKTEPKSLSIFLEERKKNPNLIQDGYKAKFDCKLDPEFPSPLMTQTLTKISKINGTEFDLLSDDEQDRFINDVEHLLLADFDDKEIRQDTRLSFAASTLTKIIPKRVFHNSDQVEKTTKLHALIIKQNKLREEKNEEKANSLNADIEKLKIEIQEINNLLAKKYNTLTLKTFKLLEKAIFENYDKIKLWYRSLEFCLNSGFDGISILLKLTDKLYNDNRASKLTVIYLKATILHILSNLSIKAFRIMISSRNEYPLIQQQRASQFLFLLIDKNLFTKLLEESNEKKYYSISKQLFENTIYSVLKSIIDGQNSQLDDEANVCDKQRLRELFPSIFARNKNLIVGGSDLSIFIWFFLSKLSYQINKPPYLWLTNIDKFKFLNPIDFSLINLFPKWIPNHILNTLIESYYNEGWLFDVVNGFEERKEVLPNIENVNIISQKKRHDQNYLSISEWIAWKNENLEILIKQYYQDGETFYDPRYSEWTALEIIKQIGLLLINKIERPIIGTTFENHYRYIHPNNYLIPKKWILVHPKRRKITWEAWDNVVNDHRVTINDKGNFIIDYRYTPKHLDPYGFEDPSSPEPIIQGLGSLLVVLLSNNMELPPQWNPIGHQRAWLGIIHTKLNDEHISSLTKMILQSIFSKKIRETNLLQLFFRNEDYAFVQEDTSIDPPFIGNLSTLINYITQSQEVLKQYRINIQEDLPRQLVPVSFKQLSREFSPYEDET